MTNKIITLSRELVERYVSSVEGHGYGFDGDAEMRAALAEPVPPAGGEPEVPTVAWLDLNKMPRAGMAYATALKVNHRQTELVDRAHVTRLQAEVERLKLMCKRREEVADQSDREATDQLVRANALQSELTKARELLTDICDTAYIQSSEGADAYGAAREYLAEQRGKS